MADMDSQCKQDNTTDVLCNNRGEWYAFRDLDNLIEPKLVYKQN